MTLGLAQTVAIGPFNPSIITPGWLMKVGIIRPEDADPTESFSGISDEGTGFVLAGSSGTWI